MEGRDPPTRQLVLLPSTIHTTRTMECDQLQSSSSDPRLHVVTCKLMAVEIVTTCINNDMQGKVTAGYVTVSNN